jgi:hypothetical protein
VRFKNQNHNENDEQVKHQSEPTCWREPPAEEEAHIPHTEGFGVRGFCEWNVTATIQPVDVYRQEKVKEK